MVGFDGGGAGPFAVRQLKASVQPDQTDAVEQASDAARYIGTLTDELAQLARRHGLDMLGYILDMARLEADQIAKGSADTLRQL